MNILIVEDEEYIRKAIKKHITEYTPTFSKILEAENGIEAVKIMRKNRPEIILMDVRMPGLSGLSVLEHFGKADYKFKVIIVSGHSDFSYAQKALLLGVSAYLLKPVKKDELYRLIDQQIKALHEERVLKEHTEKYQHLIKQEAVHSVLENRIQERNDFTHISFSAWYGVLLVEIESTGCESEVEKHLERMTSDCSDCILYQKDEKVFVVIIGFSRPNEQIFNKKAQDILYVLRHGISCHCAVSASGIGESYSSIRAMYIQAMQFMKEKVIHGDTKVLSSQNVELIQLNQYKQKLSAIAGLIETGSLQKIRRQIELLIESLGHEQKLSYPNLKILTDDLKAKIYGILSRFSISISDEIFLLDNCYNLEQYITKLTDYLLYASELLQGSKPLNGESGFEKALAFINLHFSENISLEYVAGLANLSPNYFCAVFKKRMNCNYIDYVTSLRIERAKEILRNRPAVSISQVGKLSGYENTRYFSKLFHKLTGLRPKEFRDTDTGN